MQLNKLFVVTGNGLSCTGAQ